MKSTFRILLLGSVLGLTLLLLGCDEAGSGGGDDGSGDGGDGASETTFESLSLNFLGLEYYGDDDTVGYNTDVLITSSAETLDAVMHGTEDISNETYVYFWLNDSSDLIDIEPGSYTINTSSDAVGTVSTVAIWVGMDAEGGEPTAVDAIAGTETQSSFEDAFEFSPGGFAQITSGTVEVAKSGSEYTFTWSLTTADGYTIDGSYTGSVDDQRDYSGGGAS